jgi:hypothetical protein
MGLLLDVRACERALVAPVERNQGRLDLLRVCQQVTVSNPLVAGLAAIGAVDLRNNASIPHGSG